MEKRDKEMPYEVIIQERNKVDLYGNVVYYIYWFDKYGNDITNEWKFWTLIESLEDLQDAFKQGHHVCIEVGKLPYSIGLNYLRNLQEMSVTAVDDLMGLKERSREEAFNIIQEWTKEFTEKYGNYYFDGSYYDEIDAFIEEKLRTI